MVYKRPWRVLKHLGLTEKLRKIAAVPADEDEPSEISSLSCEA
jgi:hypothetical protein